MSKVAELYTEIEDMLEKGTHPATISAVLDVPVVFVYDVIETLEGQTEELSPFRTINS
jgi:sugar-specific transcriptional regulator TrmB